MFGKNLNNTKVQLLFLIILIAVVTSFVCLSLAYNQNGGPSVKDPNAAVLAMVRKRTAAEREISRAATMGFEPSLEMKENVDFLLTAALLVQEAISEDVIITYPSE